MARVMIFCLALFVVGITSLPLAIKPSDLIAGKLQPDDKLLFTITSKGFPVPGVNITNEILEVNGQQVLINYITAVEGGDFPDARIEIIEGGPGFSNVKLRITRGPLDGYSYYIEIHGKELIAGKGVLKMTKKQILA